MSPGRLSRGQEAGWGVFQGTEIPQNCRWWRARAGWAVRRLGVGGISRSRGRARDSAPEGLKHQADGGPVCPPTCACQRGTKMCLIITGPGFRLAAPLWSEAFSISLRGSSIDGSHQCEVLFPVSWCSSAPLPLAAVSGIWAMIREGAEVRGSGELTKSLISVLCIPQAFSPQGSSGPCFLTPVPPFPKTGHSLTSFRVWLEVVVSSHSLAPQRVTLTMG